MTKRGLIPAAQRARFRAAARQIRTAASKFRAARREAKASREYARQIDKSIAEWLPTQQRWAAERKAEAQATKRAAGSEALADDGGERD